MNKFDYGKTYSCNTLCNISMLLNDYIPNPRKKYANLTGTTGQFIFESIHVRQLGHASKVVC